MTDVTLLQRLTTERFVSAALSSTETKAEITESSLVKLN